MHKCCLGNWLLSAHVPLEILLWRLSFVGGSYQQGWDDCLDAVLSILNKAKGVEEVKKKIQDLQILVKAKKFEQIKVELGVLSDLF